MSSIREKIVKNHVTHSLYVQGCEQGQPDWVHGAPGEPVRGGEGGHLPLLPPPRHGQGQPHHPQKCTCAKVKGACSPQ